MSGSTSCRGRTAVPSGRSTPSRTRSWTRCGHAASRACGSSACGSGARASQRIKQLRGNPEAVASAYSLDDYRIADDLGGEAAWHDLRDRAWARGIRLAADMVPNHMGIDSRWVMEHPEWFIAARRAALPRLFLDRPQPVERRAGGHLSRGPLRRRLGRRGRVQARRPLERRRALPVPRQRRHLASPGTTPRSSTSCAPTSGKQVIRTIIDVARRFPVIRFDAAMVLAEAPHPATVVSRSRGAAAGPSRRAPSRR